MNSKRWNLKIFDFQVRLILIQFDFSILSFFLYFDGKIYYLIGHLISIQS